MFIIHLIFTLLAAYFAKQAYDEHRFEWAIFWAVLLGWDLATIITLL